MIPSHEIDLKTLDSIHQTSKTYRLNLESKRISRFIDNEEAILQMVMKILYTERYAFVIYSSKYGIELQKLIGKDYNFVESIIEDIVRRALMADDRVLSIQNFKIEKTNIDSLTINFLVNTVAGQANIQTEVLIA